MRQIQEAEAPKLLPELLEAASLGESADIMREGVKIAKIVPGEGIESPMRVAKRREKRRKAIGEFKKRRGEAARLRHNVAGVHGVAAGGQRIVTTIILDASAAGAWMFPDESDPTVDALLDAVEEGGYDGLVPVHWFLEVRNSLVMGARRGRIAREDVAEYLSDLSSLDLTADTEADLDEVVELAMRYGLTVYDAVYLELNGAPYRFPPLPLLTPNSAARRPRPGVEILI